MIYSKIFNKELSTEYKAYFKDRECTILHREDGPAIEYPNGGKEWWVNGKRHREDGPAIEYSNGFTSYYLNGQLLFHYEYYDAITKLASKRFGGFV